MTLSRVNGRGKVNGKVSREVLERNALDILTADSDADFDECLDIVETVSRQRLIEIIAGAEES